MCGRFGLFADPATIAERTGTRVPDAYTPSYNLAPGDRVLAVEPSETATLTRWAERFNARIETAVDESAWAEPCLLPTSGFYEWRPDGQPVRIYREGDPILALAGLRLPDGVTVLTTDARPPVDAIHDRMPVTLAPDREADWLADRDREVITADPATDLAIDPVDPRLGDPTVDGPALIDGPDHEQRDLDAFG
ncbi:SOS response-associated peptidase [Halococcoides cellulosivorans]|uniref:SOS response-associated peptidase n=1 Tax=Halococcoides cellulosivorans TaxID=1679096 RepID=A0A2R4X035_9EURY|nr:SOS response-associated peptidase [Halococcoides cellulosivorans]AWB27144.1 SOS response-associated peptidase [Halococcoides cellulosivorans]